MACVRWNADVSGNEGFVAKWGLIPLWAKDVKIGGSCSNARSETVDTKPAFRSAYKKRRCLVVASGFYEWDQLTPLAKGEKKQPFYFTLRKSPVMPFAGLWETWQPDGQDVVTSCTIITSDANSLMAPIHDRLPVILPKELWDVWLDPEAAPAALKSLLVPIDSDAMQFCPVSKFVNTVNNDAPECIEPITLDNTLF